MNATATETTDPPAATKGRLADSRTRQHQRHGVRKHGANGTFYTADIQALVHGPRNPQVHGISSKRSTWATSSSRPRQFKRESRSYHRRRGSRVE